jgi:hypothetical protein
MSPTPTNTYTVSVQDQHSNTVAPTKIAAATKQEAIRDAFTVGDAEWSALTQTDTWTITVTQP